MAERRASGHPTGREAHGLHAVAPKATKKSTLLTGSLGAQHQVPSPASSLLPPSPHLPRPKGGLLTLSPVGAPVPLLAHLELFRGLAELRPDQRHPSQDSETPAHRRSH